MAAMAFGYAFPFEGNWNFSCLCCADFRFNSFGYAFPFEGNWNTGDWSEGVLWISALDMLSRLKGIETSLQLPSPTTLCTLWICFPVWRELKHYSMIPEVVLNVFGYAFPFEGNWNTTLVVVAVIFFFLWIWFPVWRELKHFDPVALAVNPVALWICFPVWRELKRWWRLVCRWCLALDMLSRLKGIETDSGNIIQKEELPALDMLSRLKGIETWALFPIL